MQFNNLHILAEIKIHKTLKLMIINYCRWILTAAISVIISLEKHAEAEQNWPEVKKLEDGLYDFDGVIIDQKNRKVKFPHDL